MKGSRVRLDQELNESVGVPVSVAGRKKEGGEAVPDKRGPEGGGLSAPKVSRGVRIPSNLARWSRPHRWGYGLEALCHYRAHKRLGSVWRLGLQPQVQSTDGDGSVSRTTLVSA